MPVGGAAVTIEGLADFRRQLKELDRDTAKEFGRAMKLLADEAGMDARGSAQGGTRQQATAAYNIAATGSSSGRGSVAVTAGDPWALGSFWGSKRPQFPGLEWVGNSWEAGVHGQGPYFINDAIADHADEFEREFPLLIEKYARKTGAFPD